MKPYIAKRLNNGEWVTGCYIQRWWDGVPPTSYIFIEKVASGDWQDLLIPVDPTTVAQCGEDCKETSVSLRRMTNPQNYLLEYEGKVAGWARTLTEYLPLGVDKWTLKQIEFDRKVKFSSLPPNIVAYPRPRFSHKDKNTGELII